MAHIAWDWMYSGDANVSAVEVGGREVPHFPEYLTWMSCSIAPHCIHGGIESAASCHHASIVGI